MSELVKDIRFALRSLAKARGFAVVAILTLAFALGANTAIYSVVSGILLRPLPFPQPDELVAVRGSGPQHPVLAFSYRSYHDVRAQAKTFEEMAGYDGFSTFLYGTGDPERVRGASATANLFPMLGVAPHLGRTFTPQEDARGQAPVVVISYGLWQRRFGGDPSIIGQQIRLGADPDTVIGVMPREFKFPIEDAEQTDVWSPLEQSPVSEGRGMGWIAAVARLREGVTLEQANAELKTIAARLTAEHPLNNTGVKYEAQKLHELVVSDVRPALLVLMMAVGVVLLIGCANVANLLLARAAVRHREMSIRAAVGATRGRIVRQLLVESTLLALLAGAVGVLLAMWGVGVLVAIAPPDIPRLDAIALDAHVLLFALILSLATGIIFGLAPALSASKTNLVAALKEGARGSTEGRGRHRIRNALVIGEIALSVILLVAAGLLLRSFVRLSGIDPGYDYRNVMTAEVAIRSAVFPSAESRVEYFRRAIEELRAIPGVESVGGASHLPLTRETTLNYGIHGRPPFAPGTGPSAALVWVSPNYFETMRMPIVQGRSITPRDGPNAPPVIVVSESIARQQFPNENPIGKQLFLGIPDEHGGGVRTIVGVVRDIRFVSLTEPPKQNIYVPVLQGPLQSFQFVVRAKNADTLGPSIRGALRQLDRDQPIVAMRTLEQMRSESLGDRRFMLVLVAALAALALILAAVGIYSTISYSVTQRTSEIGIRMSLGADARNILRLIVGDAVRLMLIGVAAGIVIALAATRVMTSLLYGITPTDPLTFASICAIVAAIALLASYVPALRATRVDPLVAIRYD